MDGSRPQLINAFALILTFFFTRLIYGSYMVFWLFYDMYRALTETVNKPVLYSSGGKSWVLEAPLRLPKWIIVMHFLAETTIHVLNFFWFYKMMKLLLRHLKGSKVKKEVVNGNGKSQFF
jgi:hypothetical protein